MSGLRLMAIHAHPDDESSKGAATMARYAAEGNQVMVVTCTGGERGDILNPAMDKPGILDNIFAVRQEEMAKAMEILGTEHRWLGYEDSGLPQGDPLPPLPEGCFALEDSDKVTQDLVKILREFRPHVIITYDENGGYPHPDHLKVHEVSMLAWEKSGDAAYAPELGAPWEPLKLYYTHGFIRQRMEMFHDLLIEQGKPSPYTPMLERWKANEADVMARVTTQVPCERFFDQRDDALRAHATQIDPAGAFFGTPVEVQRRLWPTEEFELAKTRVKTSIPEDDLFAGITPDAE
ncbi:mycothiol conjugate amidase Mca [Corynebacterium glutamicum]|uniref:Mycothiol S-conjugate amidase n=1 Tax=Corynebacterium glutamicum (strain ATCC 13032 / DSM 20300 / JCM 1318 / BCRC 11384 / CCUG 27702 / LMG 3730 / NBRC 12168 / NCIMB 10025 / NRRL B-2784 / 534) TaxID=196627 RepID=Q8NRQ7_CORGL|nr:mycothiol conjugate amidase Mca [Corynebacterium glutamicum]ARV66276.1 mycothiol conjugate amidase Mca [Corynebacterium glutamicum]AUI02514.1 mycothiol conjugate amidase Mca [Corynebacterium glutamicum]AUI05578.1 mycothiol conjugate amidase Mca [Corynebacterium glutamicum]MBA4570492.1 mycothiol conjugate amidase Mca [Corynebacterium glutamicum]MBA4574074.1 mycothiol conjugate amidase Mca [Corynebacterium glutamicum]